MTEAFLDLVQSALLMTHSEQAGLGQGIQGNWRFGEGDRGPAWRAPGVGVESVWAKQQQAKLCGPGLHQEPGRGKERVETELGHLDFVQVWATSHLPLSRKYP